ncbi:MAG: CvpA family protein [Bacilli bacterium]|nr:CvpA family protein [Bacilli bacterium]
MAIGIVDVFIVLLIILGGVVGFNNGFIREGIHFIGTIVITVVAFMFKDILMVFFYQNLPFFNFYGGLRNITSINILLYQLLAFIVIFATLFFLLRVLLVITGLIELLIKLTVFLKMSSKILGIVVGVFEYYIYIFVVLFILNMPIFNLSFVADSNLGQKMLSNTPVLSSYIEDTVYTYADVWNIIRTRKKKTDIEVNTLVLATLLDHKLVTIDNAKTLVEANKILITDEELLDKYEDDNDFYKYVKKQIAKNKKS